LRAGGRADEGSNHRRRRHGLGVHGERGRHWGLGRTRRGRHQGSEP
jgi:hypothetical protein